MRGDHARERGGEAGTGDQHADPSFPRPACVLGHRVRVAVCGANLELVRDPPRLKLVEGGLHPLAVGLRADQDPHHAAPQVRT